MTRDEMLARVLVKVDEMLQHPDVKVGVSSGIRDVMPTPPSDVMGSEYDGSQSITIRIPSTEEAHAPFK